MIARPAARHRLAAVSRARLFHTSRTAYVKVGDRLPDLADVLMESSPGNKVNLAQELSIGKGLIIGVPAAFSKFGRELRTVCPSLLLPRRIDQLTSYRSLMFSISHSRLYLASKIGISRQDLCRLRQRCICVCRNPDSPLHTSNKLV